MIFPFLTTAMLSALCTVESLWAMIMQVLPFLALSSACCTTCNKEHSDHKQYALLLLVRFQHPEQMWLHLREESLDFEQELLRWRCAAFVHQRAEYPFPLLSSRFPETVYCNVWCIIPWCIPNPHFWLAKKKFFLQSSVSASYEYSPGTAFFALKCINKIFVYNPPGV